MRSTRGSRFVFVIGVLGALAVPGMAGADVISDEEAVCQGKAKGDRCEAGGTEGACQTSTCSRNDYSDGPPPKQVSVECLLCVPGAAGEGDDAAPSDTKTEAEPASDPTPSAEPKKVEPQKGGCAVVSSSTSAIGFGFGAMILVGGFATRRSRPGGIDRA